MNEQLRFIVDTLNQPPYGKRYNLVTFSSLDSFSLLQLLNDVLAEISPEHRIDLRQEPPEQTAVRIFSLLRVLKYMPRTDEGGGLNAFRQGLLQGDRATVYPLLHWLLERTADLKKRAYLARYLVRVEVPPEFLQEDGVLEVSTTYEEHLAQFKELHRTAEQQRTSKFSVAEVRRDIASMEEEREQLGKRIARLRRKAESTPNHADMLGAARKLRMERDREVELGEQRVEQKNLLLHARQRLLRSKETLAGERSASTGLHAQDLVERLAEDNRLKAMLAADSLPHKLETKRRKCIEIERVLSEPVVSEEDLEGLRRQLEEASTETQRLMEKRMPGSNSIQDKLALFRQQASVIARKKEDAMESYKAAYDDVEAGERELKDMRAQLQATGDRVPGEEEFKRYVSSLRGKNATYKGLKSELSTLKAEYGVLARTVEVLRSRDENTQELAELLERKKGVGGYRAVQEDLEQASSVKSKLDEEKGSVLQEYSDTITQLNATIAEKKALLAPLVKEIRPLRQQHHELSAVHAEKKLSYDRVAVGLESTRSQQEQEVRALWEEKTAEESRAHYLRAMLQSVRLQQARVAAEMRTYVSGDAAEKRKSLRDQFTRRVQEQENMGKALREKQKEIRESHADSMRQVAMWRELHRLFEAKRASFLQGEELRQRERAAEEVIIAAKDRLVLS